MCGCFGRKQATFLHTHETMCDSANQLLKTNGYQIVGNIGSGKYAQVKRVWSTKHQQYLAAKIYNLEKLPSDVKETFLPSEEMISPTLKHPNLIETLEIVRNSKFIAFIQEYAAFGSLLDVITRQRSVPEDRARQIFRQLTEALHYLHNKNIKHRDVKAENILFDSFNNVKLADFGFVGFVETRGMSERFCGTTGYAPPEILTHTPYTGHTCDTWSSGIVLYVILTGKMPFTEGHELEHNIGYPSDVRDLLSDDVKTLISSLLEPVPALRAKYEDIVSSKWLKNTPWVV